MQDSQNGGKIGQIGVGRNQPAQLRIRKCRFQVWFQVFAPYKKIYIYIWVKFGFKFFAPTTTIRPTPLKDILIDHSIGLQIITKCR